MNDIVKGLEFTGPIKTSGVSWVQCCVSLIKVLFSGTKIRGAHWS